MATAKTWNSGMAQAIRSSPRTVGSRASRCATLAATARCVSSAPLGRPVVPPVNWSTASASGSTGGSATGGRGWPSSSATKPMSSSTASTRRPGKRSAISACAITSAGSASSSMGRSSCAV
ncbi:hypothetical protein CKY28_16830 [Sphingomonas lenta]|uniref:Uncharacterized protein n=1 Tax=Sphingomonas lenta TaxID=1141887 RepID=A0A2A2SBU9_9SPHN|nr:hypothetical protein CKY28_16830 [Sphingomonas lenta]